MISSPSRLVRAVCASACVAASLAAAPVAGASWLTMDVNTVTATYQGVAPFGIASTGQIVISENANTSLAGVRIDGVDQGATGVVSSVSVVINLLSGVVNSGSLSIELTDGSTYTASIQNLSGSVKTQAGQGFMVDGLTFNGAFSNLVGGTLFGGVDVSGYSGGALPGSFLHFAFQPNGQGVDTVTDLEVYVVPAPAGALALLAGLGAATRRRRA